MKKKVIGILMAAVIAIGFAGCENNGNGEVNQGKTVTITDRLGETVEIPEKIDTIISGAPSNTEILIGLGFEDKIVAADMYSADTGISEDKAYLDMSGLDIEKITALKPDVIFLNGINWSGEGDPYEALKNMGTKVYYIPVASSIEDIKADIKFISEYTGTEDKGNEMIEAIDNKIAEVKEKAASIDSKKKVYFEVGQLWSGGKGTYFNEIINLVGAENIFADQDGYIEVSEENIIEANPDVILTTLDYEGYDVKEISERVGWNVITAVKTGAVKQLDSNPVSRASQNIVDGIDIVAKAIYPEIYGNEE